MTLWQDLRYSFRTLANRPGFVLIAVLSRALGVGADTAIFTLLDQLVLRLLPVKHPEQLVQFRPRERATSSRGSPCRSVSRLGALRRVR